MPSLMSSVYLISNTVLHLLPNMLENKQSILLQDTDFSDDVCFICRRGGTIACCSTLQNTSIIFCTICKQPTHLECNIKVKNLTHPRYFEQLILGSQTYVCVACLKLRGIKNIQRIYRQIYQQNHQTNELIIVLADVNHPSPIHLGWFLEKDIRQAYQIQYKMPPNQIQRDIPAIIQRIISMRVPSIYQNEDFQTIVQILLEDQRRSGISYGGPNNFYFLTKWLANQHQDLVWEDEVVISQYSGGKQSLAKYLKRRQFQLKSESSCKFGFLQQVYLKQHQSVIVNNNYVNFWRLGKQRFVYPVYFISFKNLKQVVSEMCYMFNQMFILEEQKYPAIVIAVQQTASLWNEQLRDRCPHLETLFFNGSDKSIDNIKSIYFSDKNQTGKLSIKSKFQIMVIQQSDFILHQSFILEHLSFISIVLFSNFQGQQLLRCYSNCHLNIKKMVKNHIFLADRSKSNNQVDKQAFSKIDMFFGGQYILKHDMSNKNIEILQPILPRGAQTAIDSQLPTDNRFFKLARLTELKRIVFLRYVLQFGISTESSFELYQQLNVFAPSVFDSVSYKNKHIFQNYLASFLSLLASYSENQPQPKVVQYYLFKCDLNQVITRIIQLECLRIILKNNKSLQLPNFEVYDKDQMEKLGDIRNWTNQDDIILSNLILVEGFGCWKKIYDNKDWMRFDPRKSNREDLGFAFGTYLKLKLMTVIRRSDIDALAVIAQRAQKILDRVSDIF